MQHSGAGRLDVKDGHLCVVMVATDGASPFPRLVGLYGSAGFVEVCGYHYRG